MGKTFVILLAFVLPIPAFGNTAPPAAQMPTEENSGDKKYYFEAGWGRVSTNKISTRSEQRVLSTPGTTGTLDVKKRSDAWRVLVGRTFENKYGLEAGYVGGINFYVHSSASNSFTGISLTSKKEMGAQAIFLFLRKDIPVTDRISVFWKAGWIRYQVKFHEQISDGVDTLEDKRAEYGGFPAAGLGIVRELGGGLRVSAVFERDGASGFFFTVGRRF